MNHGLMALRWWHRFAAGGNLEKLMETLRVRMPEFDLLPTEIG